MRKWFLIMAVLLLAASCGEEQKGYQAVPAVKLTVGEQGHTLATILVESIFCDEVYVLPAAANASAPAAPDIFLYGVRVENGKALLSGLDPGCKYYAYGAGRKGDTFSTVARVQFFTGSEAEDLYPYESGRNGAPRFADLTLCTGGGKPNSNTWFTVPENWDKDRFAPHVSYVDSDGGHWLFEAFLGLTGIDPDGKTFCISGSGAQSADKASWEALVEYWLGEEGAFKALDEAIGEAALQIGRAPSKRYAVMMMPDPIMLERFTDKSSSTSYWGALDGKRLDFSDSDDQIKALKWYIDFVRAEFADRDFKNLELAGFYIISEELVAKPGGWNYGQKRWDQILPVVGDYLDSCNEGLYWIPYLGADGTDIWQSLGITYSWLQPGYYWDSGKTLSSTVKKIKQYGMGIELEFEYSMVESVMKTPGILGPDAKGNLTFTLQDVPVLRERFRAYMSAFKDGGLYGKERIALYSGSNALYQLATSKEKDDIALYLELCRYISENPLRR